MKSKHQLFQAHFGTCCQLSPDVLAYLDEAFSERTFEAREFVTEAGKVERYFSFVQSGVQAGYLIDSKGEKRVFGFSYEGNPSGIFDSFIGQKPSDYFMEALTTSSLISITKSKYDKLFDLFPDLRVWRVNFAEQILFGRGKREVELLTKTARERFKAFTDRCPKELLTIPQKYLASYLNMTPETYSRLRAEKH